ncbi:hypothetical protein [Thioclava sp. JE_KL1]|uniref:hypothetical protein n=1 Tax=Thioclava sp. JE_KL1 TaxID=2651187 RepID=UPI00128B8B2C|nr:hypothetical protein [Thioclava sp. JE_KL1]MPQ92501.1 hypothetical protein [Thioclava sp. JE_KL1]
MFDLHWTEYLKALGPTLIAGIVAYVAWQQWRVNRAALREKLFDRRWDIFNETQAFLSTTLSGGKVHDDDLARYSDTCQRARFLLGKDLSDYLEKIRTHAITMRMHRMKIEGLEPGEERSKHIHGEYDELRWLTDQLGATFKKFMPYLSFSDIE